MLKVIFLVSISVACLQGQDASTFDVISIRPQAPGDTSFVVHMPRNGQFSARGAVATLVLMLAYDVQESQIIGGPNWFATEKWEIDAPRDDGITHSVEETRLMLQKMLENRFALRIHRETEQLPVYALTIAKGGPKFKPLEENGRTNGTVRVASKSISLESVDLVRMAQVLATALGRPVIDRTGLTGRYNLNLQWDDAPIPQGGVPGLDVPAPPGDEYGSIFTAIQDQLGLRLESQRAPVDVIVIDRIERPSAN
jgi:bla regulator protein blaR1